VNDAQTGLPAVAIGLAALTTTVNHPQTGLPALAALSQTVAALTATVNNVDVGVKNNRIRLLFTTTSKILFVLHGLI
jgi:hypothetical protein